MITEITSVPRNEISHKTKFIGRYLFDADNYWSPDPGLAVNRTRANSQKIIFYWSKLLRQNGEETEEVEVVF